MKRLVVISLAAAVLLISCNHQVMPESVKTKNEIEYEMSWEDVFGKVNPEKTWSGSAVASINVKNAGDAQISIYSLGESKRVLLARETVSSDATITFDMPLGLDYGISVCKENAEGTTYMSVNNSQLAAGTATVDFAVASTKADFPAITEQNKAALTMPTAVSQATGERAKIWGYTNFPSWIWFDINEAIPENKSAVEMGQITNFDLQSNGIFYIAAIYGATGTSSAEIGYYYYTGEAKPENITYVPLIDALRADYYYDEITISKEEALPKVLWADKSWKWTPANFCYYDTVGGMNSSGFKTRTGDNQFSTLSIHETYGNIDPSKSGISLIKGLTFQVNAPKGSMVGFYCKTASTRNHTTAGLNTSKRSRAAIKVYDGFRFIGLEDGTATSKNEPDCNDIAFVMVPGNDGVLPGLFLPYIKDNDSDKYYNGDGTLTEEPKYDVATDGPDQIHEDLAAQKNIWTMAFEDMATKGDFDFNDLVLTIVPDKKTANADIYICATGGTISSYLYYGEEQIGEIHSLLGSIEGGKNVIANTHSQKYQMKKIRTINLNKNTKIEDVARKFKLIVGNDVVTLPEKGEVPKAILVPGFWAWPKESTRIDKAYTRFADWAYDGKNSNHAGWYKHPEEGKTVIF